MTLRIAALYLTVLVAAIITAFSLASQVTFGSVTQGNEYNATTTFAASTDIRVLKSVGGALGSVVITGDNTGTMTFYNATTSDITLRNNIATSSLVIADFPASSPEGTYTFDVTFTTGLLLVSTGAEATSTVTWR